MRGQRSRTRPVLDTTAGVKTDRVVTDRTAPQPLWSCLRPMSTAGALARVDPGALARIDNGTLARKITVAGTCVAADALAVGVGDKLARLRVGGRRLRRWSWAAVTLLVGVAVYALIVRQDSSTSAPRRRSALSTRAKPVTAVTTTAQPAAPAGPADPSRLESQEVLITARLPIATTVGNLTIGHTDEFVPPGFCLMAWPSRACATTLFR